MKKLLKDVKLKKNIRKNKIYMISLLYLMKEKIKKQTFIISFSRYMTFKTNQQ